VHVPFAAVTAGCTGGSVVAADVGAAESVAAALVVEACVAGADVTADVGVPWADALLADDVHPAKAQPAVRTVKASAARRPAVEIRIMMPLLQENVRVAPS